jgi:pantoate--beta-alanine ligase
MEVFSDIDVIRRKRWQEASLCWGLVPTMGFLHAGHLSLVRRARQENGRVGVSIFVNPLQFNNPDDLSVYPRNMERDLQLLQEAGANLVWTPTLDRVYPADFQTHVEVEKVSAPLEGAARPGHFRGVTTVVAKLFNVFQPHRAYFGQKDAQQVRVIRQMVKDLNFNLDIVVCPTVREPDGLAMSSRNANLSAAGRTQASCLYRALTAAQDRFDAGERHANVLQDVMRAVIEPVQSARIDYVSVADPETLTELDTIAQQALLSLAVFIGDVRLIDNLVVGL